MRVLGTFYSFKRRAEMRHIDTQTRLCAVIGNPIEHSLSPAIHNAAYDALGINFVYLAFRVEDLGGALAGMRSLENFRGMSITIPHKLEAIKYVDEIAQVDRHIGSINTVVNEGGRLIGSNTDGPGALKALSDAGADCGKSNILILGAGGVARAIAFTLAMKADPSEIALLDIDNKVLAALARDLEKSTDIPIRSAAMSENTLAGFMERADVVIHCTPVGMHPHTGESVVPADMFRPGQVVFDVVYTPLETKLLADAASRGALTISGVEMFIGQAVLQFERFTGADAPVDVMRKVVMEHLRS